MKLDLIKKNRKQRDRIELKAVDSVMNATGYNCNKAKQNKKTKQFEFI